MTDWRGAVVKRQAVPPTSAGALTRLSPRRSLHPPIVGLVGSQCGDLRLESWYPDTMIPVSDEGPDKTNALQPAAPGQLDLGPGQWMIARGSRTEFFAIGALARALNRKPVTLRKWEAAGQLPKSGWQDARVRGRGKRRLYTRAQIEAAVRIAAEEGILVETRRAVSKTRFGDRLIKAWKELGD
jgi:hypothetical protein